MDNNVTKYLSAVTLLLLGGWLMDQGHLIPGMILMGAVALVMFLWLL